MTEILSAEQLAERLGLHPESIRKLTRDGSLPHHRIGASVRYTLVDVLAATAVNQHPDDEAVDSFAAAMHDKMAQARAKGKEGWDDPERCPERRLHEMCLAAVDRCQWVDVANYAMMLWNRGQK